MHVHSISSYRSPYYNGKQTHTWCTFSCDSQSFLIVEQRCNFKFSRVFHINIHVLIDEMALYWMERLPFEQHQEDYWCLKSRTKILFELSKGKISAFCVIGTSKSLSTIGYFESTKLKISRFQYIFCLPLKHAAFTHNNLPPWGDSEKFLIMNCIPIHFAKPNILYCFLP